MDFESFLKIVVRQDFKVLSVAVADAIRDYKDTYDGADLVERRFKRFFETVENDVGVRRRKKESDPDKKPNEGYYELIRDGRGSRRFVNGCYFWFRYYCEFTTFAKTIDAAVFGGRGFPLGASPDEDHLSAPKPTDPEELSFDPVIRERENRVPLRVANSYGIAPETTIETAGNLDQNPGAQTSPRNDGKDTPLSSPSAPFEWPPYVSEADARSPDAHEGIWLNPFNHYSIPFSHRQAEKARLDAFMKDDRPFLICALVASSGAGKTRLVSEWMRPYVPVDGNDTDWDAGFVRSRDPAGWKEWEITRKTLIVIDYTYGYEKVMRAITEKCLRHDGPKVRVLVVDHVYPDILHDDFFWGSSFADQKRIDGHKSRVLFEASPIEIKAEKPDSRLIREIIAVAARTEAREFSPDDAAVIAAEKILDRMAGSTGVGHPDAVRHPLFAALLGQAIRDAKKDISNWSRRDLIRHYFDRRTRLPWVQMDDNPHAATIGVWVGAYVSIATLLRGVNFADLEENLPKGILSDRSPIRLSNVVAQSANRIVSSSDLEVLKPFEPDILGENFLILFLQEIENNDSLFSSFVHMMDKIYTLDVNEKYALNFIETVQRLIRNLLNDDQKLRAVRNAWSTLLHFLNPVHFPADSLFRQAVSISCADVIRQGRGSLEDKLVNRFADRLDVADLHAASAGPLGRQSCAALVQHYDWRACQGQLKSGEADTLFASISRFMDRSEGRSSALRLAVYEGCLDSAKAIHSHFAEDVNTSQTDGWTILMVASYRGHTPLVGWLHSLGAEVDLTLRDNGWTALMAACAEGHAAAANCLLDCGADPNLGTSDNGKTALMAACAAGHSEVSALLLDRGADPDIVAISDGYTALIAASRNNNLQSAIQLLSKSTKSINFRTDEGWHALYISASDGDLEMVKLLLSCMDIDIDNPAIFGLTALHMAAGNGHADVIIALIERGADVNHRAIHQISPLMIASGAGQVSCVNILLSRNNIEINAVNEDGQSALDVAYFENKSHIVEILLRSGAKRAEQIRQN